jgi:glycosyltransferase involved in cell wall biosynthesis
VTGSRPALLADRHELTELPRDNPHPADGRIRVLQIIARLNVGGPALMAAVLSEMLDPGRFDQRILAGSIGEGEGDYASMRAPNMPVLKVRGLGRAPRPADDLRALVGLITLIRRFRPHIVHTHTAKAGVLGRLAAWSCGVPATVHSYHGHLLHGYFSPAGRAAVIGVERVLARPTSRLVAVGDRTRTDLLAAGIGRPDQFAVVPPGTRLGPLPSRSAARRTLGLRADSVVVTLVARLTPIKRPERFVQLAGALAGIQPDVEFVVAGGGELLEPLERTAARLQAPIRFLGWRSDVETVYSASDVVVLTSDNEGMPVSLIEAALAGRPCVTTDVGGASEVVASETTGIVTPTDVDALADAVVRLVRDKKLREAMGAAAAARAARFYGAERLGDDMAGIYEELAGRRSAVLAS